MLEVIVTSLAEAVEAERGGADRLELVRGLQEGGLTPSRELVRNVARSVSIPVRVILRSRGDFLAGDADSLQQLCLQARELAQLPIDGLVAGFTNNGEVDLVSMRAVLASAPDLRVTFHRAFDSLPQLAALEQIRRLPQVDRVLTNGGTGDYKARRQTLAALQEAAAPEITILAGGGLTPELLAYLREEETLSEFHVGRAARVPAETFGAVRRTRVAALKSLLT